MLGPDFISDHITVSAGPVIANVCGSLVLLFIAGPVIANVCGSLVLLFIAAISSVGPVIANVCGSRPLYY